MSRGLTLCTLMQHFIAQPFIFSISKAFQVAGTLKEESNDRYKSCSLPVSEEQELLDSCSAIYFCRRPRVKQFPSFAYNSYMGSASL